MALTVDVLIVGAGPAGIAAAVGATRNGCRTLLVDGAAAPGGLVATAWISTLCGLYVARRDAGPEMIYDGLVQEFIDKLSAADKVNGPVRFGSHYVLPCRPATFTRVAREWLAAEKRVDCWTGAALVGVRTGNRRITAAHVTRAGRREQIRPTVVVDCSGDAVVSALAHIPLLEKEDNDQAPAVVLPLGHVSAPLATAADRLRIMLAVQHAVDDGDLATGSETVSLMPTLDAGGVLLKLNLGAAAARRPARAKMLAGQLAAFLRRAVAGFERCEVLGGPVRVVHRAGRRMVGQYRLTAMDVLQARDFPDRVTRGCWPIEKWSAAGKPTLVALPAGKWYTIPAGSLCSAHLDNLFGAGKTMSADNDAIASARVVGCCLATGAAAGELAAARSAAG